MVRGRAACGGEAGGSDEEFCCSCGAGRAVIVRVDGKIRNGTVGLELHAKVGICVRESGEEWVGDVGDDGMMRIDAV
jgi:hypothetical protein